MAPTSLLYSLTQIGNPFIKMILRSPLHGLMSASTMLITFTGRKSGRHFTTPVNYVRDGHTLLTLSQPERTWWRNLRGGAVVQVWLQGQELSARAEVVEAEIEVAACLQRILKQSPALGPYFGVHLDASQQPRLDELKQAAAHRVCVLTQLGSSR